jgi:hypothetical protein
MSIPLISNLGFTEVNSAGNLNDKAGVAKSKLPIQFFKLTDNITGNLTLDNDSAHKKIILDTNGFSITNSTGSPLTTNSSTILELKGNGNIQSTLKTSNASQTSSNFLGTTTFDNSNSSTILVSDVVTDTTVEKYVDFTSGSSYRYNGSTLDSSATFTVGADTPNASTIFGTGSSYFNTSGGTPFFIGDTVVGGGSPVGSNYQLSIASIPPNTVSQLRMDEYANISIGQYPFAATGHNRYSSDPNFHRVQSFSSPRRLWWRFVRSGNDRGFLFTNNLSISCTLSGDVLNGDTASAGGTATANKSNTTDGSFDVTMAISGTNGSGQPYALVNVNNGTGTFNTDNYTGTLSTRAF